MIKSEHERRQILKPYLIDGWSGRKNKKAMALNEPDAHMSMEMKYFRQFHIFYIHVIEWMLIYLFWVSNEKKGKKWRRKTVDESQFWWKDFFCRSCLEWIELQQCLILNIRKKAENYWYLRKLYDTGILKKWEEKEIKIQEFSLKCQWNWAYFCGPTLKNLFYLAFENCVCADSAICILRRSFVF